MTMRFRPLCWLLACLICWSTAPVAQAADSLTERLLADARDGALDQFDLTAACLIAGGVTDERDLAILQVQIAERLSLSSPSCPLALSAADQAEAHLRRLHESSLTGRYDKHATDLRQVLASGDFNCLSALVLYVELCRQYGIELEVWSQPGHVYCRLRESDIRVEPASPRWPSACKCVTPSAAARRITPVQLVGKFYYNRGVGLLEHQQYEAGIEAMRLACRLDPEDADARTNLLAGLNNWALALASDDQPYAAAALISRGLAIDPAFAPLVANERYVHGLIARPR